MHQIIKSDSNVVTHLSTYGLALFLFLTPFEYPLADLIAISPLRIVGLIAMALAVLDVLMQKIIKFDHRIIFITLWLIYGLFTYVWAIDESRFQSFFLIYINNALMFLLFSMVSFSNHEADVLKKSMVFGVGAMLLYMTFVPNAVIYSTYQNRLTLNAGEAGLDQNYLAALMIISYGIVFYKFNNNNQKKKHKIISIIFCLAILYYIVLTGSRSGLIAVLLVTLLCLNTSWKKRLSIGIMVIVVMFVLFPLVIQYLPEGLMNRFSLSALTGQEEESGARLIIWRQALNSLKDLRWVYGYGVGSSQSIVGDILGFGKGMAIHNHYIASIVEVGILGSILLIVPIVEMLKNAVKHDKSIAIAFSGILLMALFIDVLTTKFFWSAMILLSICTFGRNDISAKERF